MLAVNTQYLDGEAIYYRIKGTMPSGLRRMLPNYAEFIGHPYVLQGTRMLVLTEQGWRRLEAIMGANGRTYLMIYALRLGTKHEHGIESQSQ